MTDHEKVTVTMFRLERTEITTDRETYEDYVRIDAVEELSRHPETTGDERSDTVLIGPDGGVTDPFHHGADNGTDLITFLEPVLKLISTEDLYAYFEARVEAEGMAAVAKILEA